MAAPSPKATLQRYLDVAREALLWKLDGLDEYDLRRPVTPTGTNLLGLIKHAASLELGYLGDVFGRPAGIALPWFEPDAEPNADLWVLPEESTASILELHRAARAHADATIDALALDATGRVPWWGDHGEVTLHQILVHLTTELHRHAGHADVCREMIDGEVGFRRSATNLPDVDATWWRGHRERVEAAAVIAAGRAGSAADLDRP